MAAGTTESSCSSMRRSQRENTGNDRNLFNYQNPFQCRTSSNKVTPSKLSQTVPPIGDEHMCYGAILNQMTTIYNLK